MQSSGYISQSVLHLKRSHVIQPIGGVSARPLSSPKHGSEVRANARIARIFILTRYASAKEWEIGEGVDLHSSREEECCQFKGIK